MKLSETDQSAVQEALRVVRELAEDCVPFGDLDTIRDALGATRAAILRAHLTLNTAEENARAAARQRLETVA